MGFQRGGAAAPPIVERARRKPSEQQAKQEALRRLQTVDKVPFGGVWGETLRFFDKWKRGE